MAHWADDVGLLLVGHGTRDPQGIGEFSETVRLVAERLPSAAVEPSFLELATPTIDTGLERLVARGKRKIVVAPLLLFAAGHAKQDVPAAVAAAAQKFPDVQWRQAAVLGCHSSLMQLSANRFHDAARAIAPAPRSLRLIVVGRGSHDSEATRETVRYAEMLAGMVGVADVQAGFLAMAEPRLQAALEEAARSANDVIVVQPHLLFHGELLGEVQQRVTDWRLQVPTKGWTVAKHLGPAPEVVAAIVDRCRQSLTTT